LVRNRADSRDGLGAGWPNSSRREIKERWWGRAWKVSRFGTGGIDGGLSFYGRSGAAIVIQTTRVSGGGNTGLDNGQPVRSWRCDRGCGKRWQSDMMTSYGRGTEKDGSNGPKNRPRWWEERGELRVSIL
jgi:hypothetical protein